MHAHFLERKLLHSSFKDYVRASPRRSYLSGRQIIVMCISYPMLYISLYHVNLTCRVTSLASNSAFPCRMTFNASNRCTSCFQYVLSPQSQSIPLFSTLTLFNLHLPHLDKLTHIWTHKISVIVIENSTWENKISYLCPYCNIDSPLSAILVEPITFSATMIRLPSSWKREHRLA